jgi:hypothetical protein
MNKVMLKLGTVFALVLMAGGVYAATVSFEIAHSSQGLVGQEYYAKRPNAEHFVKEGESPNSDAILWATFPKDTLVCIPVAIDPWTKYANYYFQVNSESGYTRAQVSGTPHDPQINLLNDNGAKLLPYARGKLPTTPDWHVVEATACGE